MADLNGLPYYKAYPRDFIDGTVGMPFEIKCAYRVILDLIYIQGGMLPDDPRYISGSLGCSVRKWKSIRADLVRLGKLHVSGEFLTNKRADKELETSGKYQENQAENARKPSKIKDLKKPPQSQRAIYTESEPDIDTLPNGSDGQAVNGFSDPDDFASEVFNRGVAFLSRKGTAEKQARAFIGKLRKDHSDTEIFEAFDRCSKAGAVDPIPWITKALQKPPERTIAPRIDTSRLNPDGSYRYDT